MENRIYEEHTVNGPRVDAATNANGYSPEFRPSLLELAVTQCRPPIKR